MSSFKAALPILQMLGGSSSPILPMKGKKTFTAWGRSFGLKMPCDLGWIGVLLHLNRNGLSSLRFHDADGP